MYPLSDLCENCNSGKTTRKTEVYSKKYQLVNASYTDINITINSPMVSSFRCHFFKKSIRTRRGFYPSKASACTNKLQRENHLVAPTFLEVTKVHKRQQDFHINMIENK